MNFYQNTTFDSYNYHNITIIVLNFIVCDQLKKLKVTVNTKVIFIK